MGVAGELLLTLFGVAVIVAAPLEIAFGALVAFWLLVPGNLQVPYAPHLFLVHRVVLYAFAFRLLVRHGHKEPKAGAYRPTPMHAALGVLLLVTFFDGVVFASRTDSLSADLHKWYTMLDLAVLFVVVVAVVRTISPKKALNVVACGAVAAVMIGLFERWIGHGWANFFFEHIPANDLAAGAGPLQTRAGHVRSQGAAQFALEYGWVLTMLLPLAIVAAIRWARGNPRWRRVALVLPLLVALAVVFSGSRLPQFAMLVTVVLLFVIAGPDRRLAAYGVAAGLGGAVVLIAHPSFITSPFSTTSTNDPASIRLDRLPPLFALVVHHPFTGLGFNGIASVFGGLDDAFALTYSTLGVLGVLAWLVVGLTALAICARALRASPGSDARLIGAACLVGIVVTALAATNYDLVDTPQSTWALVFLAAIGTCAAEMVPRTVGARRKWLARLVLPVAGVGVGFAVLAAAPTAASESLSVFTVAPWVVASQGNAVESPQGTELVHTLCTSVTNPDTIEPGTNVTCLQGAKIFPADYPGLALVTISGPTAQAVQAELKSAFTPIARYMALEGGPVGTIETGKPSWAVTAPLSGGVAGLMAMLLLPPLTRRRRRLVDAPLESHHVGWTFEAHPAPV
ncbi:MAG TPA: hypothetical protein VMR97_08950 [Acidimicrobiales bacterium]|nr:hypothetical protein [Acidimicrobiales bacterium]